MSCSSLMGLLRAAIIGMGPMGFRHLEAYSQLENVKVVAVADLQESVKALLPKTITFYTNYSDLFKQENIDIVSVVTTGPHHAPIVISAAKQGVKMILCEKPMATSILEAQEMIEICKKNAVSLAINHVFREYETYKRLKCLLAEGIIGEIRHIHCVDGGGRLGCSGTHFFDTMRMFTGSDFAWVIGFIDKNYCGDHKGRKVYDPGGYGMMAFNNGIRATLELSDDIGTPEIIIISGSVGRIIIDKNRNTYQIFTRSKEDKQKRLGEYDLPLYEIPFDPGSEFDVIDATKKTISKLCDGQRPACQGKDGLAAIEVALAFHISQRDDNRKVMLPLKEKDYNVQIT